MTSGALEASIERGRLRKRDALLAVLDVVRDGGVEWRDLLEAWVQDAAGRGLLVLDGDGLVHARVLGVPTIEDVPDAPLVDRYAELRRRSAEDHARVLRDPDLLQSRVSAQREAAALNIVLEGGYASG